MPLRLTYAFEPARLGLVVGVLDVDQVLEQHPDIVAAINGPMWGGPNGIAGDIEARHLDLAAGINVPGTRPKQGATVAVAEGRVVVSAGAAVPPGAAVAVQGFPRLVCAGKVASGAGSVPGAESVLMRAGLGVLDDGRVLFAVGVGTGPLFARELVGAGCTEAVYLDGGSPTCLAVREGERRQHPKRERPASWVVARG